MRSILSKDFKYTPAAATDIRRTIRNERARLKAEAQERARLKAEAEKQKVVQLNPVQCEESYCPAVMIATSASRRKYKPSTKTPPEWQ